MIVAHPGQKELLSVSRKILILVISFLIIIAVFLQSAGHDFVNYDDQAYVTDNNRVKAGLTYQGIVWAFTTFHAANWHPLTWLSHMLDCELYGLNPMGHHLTNICLHVVNTLLLFYLLYGPTRKYWHSLFVSVLFAVHPLHVESVAWVAERKDLLSTLFLFVTLILYDRYVRHLSLKLYILTLLIYALGLMSKPMLVTLPFVMLLWDFWPLGRWQLRTKPTEERAPNTQKESSASTGSRLFGEKIPFFALSLASCIVTYYAQRQAGAVAGIHTLPYSFRAINALVSYVKYMVYMFWPHHLAVIYPLPPTLTVVEGLMAGLFMIGISYLVYRLARPHTYFLVGWLWYLGTLVPVIGLVQVGKQAMADRYTYIPLTGLFIMVAWGIPALLQKSRYRRIALPAAAGLSLVALATCTWVQLSYWKNGVMLFSHAIKAVPDNYIAHRILGNALAEQGAFAEAERSFRASLCIRPDDEETHTEWGAALAKQKKIDEAIDHFTAALEINPYSANAHYNLGIVLAEKGRVAESISHYLEALRISTGREDVHTNLGSAYLGTGKTKEALYHYQKALSMDPDNSDLNYNLGLAYGMNGNLTESITYLSVAVKINPRFAEAHYNLGVALVRAGRFDEGIGHFSEALRVNPNFEEARKTLEAAMTLKSGQLPPK
jgi:tetratricopeptide (TPR) repeat protein